MNKLGLLFSFFLPLCASGQYGYITGKLYDRFGPLSDAAVVIEGTPFGTFSDENGYFAFEIDTGYYSLKIELPGYEKTTVEVELNNLDQKEIEVQLESELLDADVGVGSKTSVSQNQLESPVPIDVIHGKQFISSGQTELSTALHYLLPSFYSVKQSADDPLNLVDPISLRGLGPDQILVLINGKRRHKSALINVSDVFGRGTTTTDLNTIPITAIDRIEVLRDGASSQYGSDAIGGVINIILKNKSFTPVINTYYGTSTEGDGEVINTEFNFGLRLDRSGFVNITTAFTDHKAFNRGGRYSGQLFSVPQLENSEIARNAVYDNIDFPNQTIFELGGSRYQSGSFLLNSRLKLNKDFDFYSFGGLSYRVGEVPATYRLPYRENLNVSAIYPVGFSPIIETELIDKSLVLGLEGSVGDWLIDVSLASGTSEVDITVDNSVNPSYRILSSTGAFAGAYNYQDNIFGFEASREFEAGRSRFDVAFGGEFRVEEYRMLEGETESYENGADLFEGDSAQNNDLATGMQGYFGVAEADALKEVRTNVSFYAEVDYAIGGLLISIADRFEQYSDFGSRNNYKTALRYKFANQFLLRASYSTGFKAPTLHQQFYQRMSNPLNAVSPNVLILNSESVFELGLLVPELGLSLQPETSESYSVGFTSSLSRFLSLSVDAYSTEISDRIGLPTAVGIDELALLAQGVPESSELLELYTAFLSESGAESVTSFVNLFDTDTYGFDVELAAHYNASFANFQLRSAFSFMQTEIVGLDGLEGETVDEFYRGEASQIESSVPTHQWSSSVEMSISKLSVTLSHTRFGETEYLHPEDFEEGNWVLNENTGLVESRDQKFAAKDLFNLNIKYNIFDNLNLSLGGINITNQYPDKLTHSANIRDGVFTYSPFVRQFNLRGAYSYARLNFTL